jgi:uncharacterized protein (TIGR02147 family)
MKTPNIFSYNDFRSYLADYQKARWTADRSFNKSRFSTLLGLPNTRSYFTDVLHGKKVSTIFIERFIKIMLLNKEEANFFRVLILFNQAETPDERELYFNQLIALNRTPTREIGKDLFDYYSNWYNSVIRALLNTFDFRDDYIDLAKKVFPKISAKEAKESVELLLKLNLIAVDARGFLKPTEKSITASPEVTRELIINYHLSCLELAKKAIVQNKTQHQTVTTNTISISEEGYLRLEKKIRQFRSEIRSLVHKDEKQADRVYQLNILLFPNSRQKDTK